MNDDITLTLSRADADLIDRLYHDGVDSAVEPLIVRLWDALSAPAEGPERAATGETLEALIEACQARGWRLDCRLNVDARMWRATINGDRARLNIDPLIAIEAAMISAMDALRAAGEERGA